MAQTPHQRTPAEKARVLRESLRLASELADALTAQAARVKRQCQQLEEVLGRLPALPDSAPAPQARELRRAAVANGPVEESPARLAAMEMAVQGSSRQEIEDYLRENLDVAEVDEILDQVLLGRGE
ncbi:MAG TPA: hypothetical protein VGY97_08215 [Solirubrobacteraceae bacterium]|nr:hypothetical protein [Solirubrobacteraceae bacterium]